MATGGRRGLHTTILTALIISTASLHFQLQGGDERCFLEEVPGGGMQLLGEVVVLNALGNNAPLPRLAIVATATRTDDGRPLPLRCRGRDGRTQTDGNLGARGGTFVGTASEEGAEYQVCVATNASWAGGAAVRLHVRMAEREGDPEREEAAAHLGRLHTRINQLVERVEVIGAAQKYARRQEEQFNVATVATSGMVVWWSLAQTCLLAVAGAWQLSHLRGFFDRRVRI